MLEIVMKAVLNTTSVKTQKNVKKFYVHLEMILLVRNVLYNFFLCLSLNLSYIFQTIIWWKYVWDQGYYIHINTNNISWHPPPGNHISHRQPQGFPGSISSPRSRRLGDKMEAKWCQMSEVVQFIERERKTVPIKTFLHF